MMPAASAYKLNMKNENERILTMGKKNVMSCALFISLVFFIIHGLGTSLESSAVSPSIIPKVDAKVKIDGILNEQVWQEALALELNYEVYPGKNIDAPVKTIVLLAYSSNHLYAAFQAYDPNPSEIRAHVTDRDNIGEDDYLGIVLDTFNDSRLTYNFYCNPFGIQAEKIVNTSGIDNQWDAIWNSAGRITKEGYIVEMEIPFSVLRFQRKNQDQVWGIDAVRIYPRSLVHVIGLFPRDRNNNCYMCQAHKIIGFNGVKPGKNIELAPTLTGLLTQERESFPEGKFAYKTRKLDPGLSARWRFTPNLTMSAAVNPDFSNVEADAAQLDINTQFALYYPEKRPFFMEDANLFDAPFGIIYSRILVDPDWGIKLSGKEGANAIGFFSVHDNQTLIIFPSSQRSQTVSIDMPNHSTALRYRRDIGRSSVLGLTVTDREGEDYYNRVVGLDGFFKLSGRDLFVFQLFGSWTGYPEDVAGEYEYEQSNGNLKGRLLAFHYSHDTEHYGMFLTYHNISTGFRANLGRTNEVDYNYIHGGGRFTLLRDPGHWYTRINTVATYQYEEDHDDHNLLNKAFTLEVDYDGPWQSFIYLTLNIGNRGYLGGLFRENFLAFNVGARPSGSFSMAIQGAYGDQIDYANLQAGSRLRINPIMQYKIGRHLFVNLNHVYEKLDAAGGRLYTANLSDLSLVYQFNRRTLLRAILQYAHFNYNPDLYSFYVDPKFNHLFSQVLFSYKINAQTVLFLGYSDDYYGFSFMPTIKQNNRTLFLKIGYALVM
jgi:hypothetical protein